MLDLVCLLSEVVPIDQVLQGLPFRPQSLNKRGYLPEPLENSLRKHESTGRIALIDAGSSRSVYSIGGGQVLKVASNQSGLIQNRQEVQTHEKFGGSGWTAKVHRWDPKFQWLIMEQVQELNKTPDWLREPLEFGPEAPPDCSDWVDAGVYLDWESEHAHTKTQKACMAVVKPTENLRRFREFLRSAGVSSADIFHQWGRTSNGNEVLYDFGAGSSLWKFWAKK